MAAKIIDVDLVKECFDYDPCTGVLTWKHRPAQHFTSEKSYKIWNKKFPGKRAGTEDKPRKGKTGRYCYITINWNRLPAHRIVWAILYNENPDESLVIDHIDGDGLNNRESNLRLVSSKENCKNSRMRPNNSSGVNGVYFHKAAQKWCAEGSSFEGGVKKKHYLGIFDSIEDAELARKKWESEQGGFSEKHGK